MWVGQPAAVAQCWDQVSALRELPFQHRTQERNKDVPCRIEMALDGQRAWRGRGGHVGHDGQASLGKELWAEARSEPDIWPTQGLLSVASKTLF